MHEDFETEARRIKEEIEPAIRPFDRTRKFDLLFLLIVTPLLWLATIPPVYFMVLPRTSFLDNPEISLEFILPAIIIAVLEAISIYMVFDAHYRNKVKRHIFNKSILPAFKAQYFPLGTLKAGSLYDHYFLPKYSKDKAEDEFRFTLSGRQVNIQELRLYGEGSEIHHIFPVLFQLGRITKGLIIRIESRKRQIHHTLAVPKSFGKIQRMKANYFGLAHYERVPYGNKALGKTHVILSEHPADAHDIFDPAFTEKFIELKKILHAKKLTVSFKGDEIIFFAEDAHDFFEFGNLLSPINLKHIRRVLKEIHQIDEIIKILKLNPYVGL